MYGAFDATYLAKRMHAFIGTRAADKRRKDPHAPQSRAQHVLDAAPVRLRLRTAKFRAVIGIDELELYALGVCARCEDARICGGIWRGAYFAYVRKFIRYKVACRRAFNNIFELGRVCRSVCGNARFVGGICFAGVCGMNCVNFFYACRTNIQSGGIGGIFTGGI